MARSRIGNGRDRTRGNGTTPDLHEGRATATSLSALSGSFGGTDRTWFVPADSDGKLRSPYERADGSDTIKAAGPFSASLVTVMIGEDFDTGWFRGDNDLLILTTCALGEQPQVERVHFYEKNIPAGTPLRDEIISNSVHVCDDYSGLDKLWIELKVIEIDRDNDGRNAAVGAFQSLAQTAGAVFPAFLPYTFAASTLAGLANKLIAAIERDQPALRAPIALYPGEPRFGRAMLQEGVYIAFSKAVDPEKYTLQKSGLLKSDDPDGELSYVAFEVRPDKDLSPAFVISQKIATLLTQLKEDDKSRSVKSTIDFLAETLTSYDNFRKLERYLQLKKKQNLSQEEKDLMEKIKAISGLTPFLPQ